MDNYYDLFENSSIQNPESAAPSFDKKSWGEKKQAEKKYAYQTIDSVLTKVTSCPTEFQNYLWIQSRMDKYSVGNTALLYEQKPCASQIKDYDGWKELGVSIRSREKGFLILEPGNEYTKADGTRGISYHTKKVFDISQTNCKEHPPSTIVKNDRLLIKALVHNATASVVAVDELPDSQRNAIYIPESNQVNVKRGLATDLLFSALSQELAYAALTNTPNAGTTNMSTNHAVNSHLKAHCISYMLCKRFGVKDIQFDFSAIPHAFAQMESQDIRATLSEIREHFCTISDRMSYTIAKDSPQKVTDTVR